MSMQLKLCTVWFFCAIQLYCCPHITRNTLISHSAALGDTLLRYNEHGSRILFWISPSAAAVTSGWKIRSEPWTMSQKISSFRKSHSVHRVNLYFPVFIYSKMLGAECHWEVIVLVFSVDFADNILWILLPGLFSLWNAEILIWSLNCISRSSCVSSAQKKRPSAVGEILVGEWVFPLCF